MIRSFKNAVVVVTGAGSGIGRALGQVFAQKGAHLVLADINADRLQTVAAEIGTRGGRADTYVVDVAKESQMAGFARDVIDTHGTVDVLINNAGVALGGELINTTLEQYRFLMDVNFWGVVHGVHFFTPAMIAQGRGHIVNIASINAIVPMAYNGPYNASKFAVLGYSISLRLEYAQHGIGVTAVCPGLIRTNIARDRQGSTSANPRVQRALDAFTRAMDRKGADPLVVAKAIPPAIQKNQAVLKVPFDSVWLAFFYTHFPGLFEHLSQRIIQGKPMFYHKDVWKKIKRFTSHKWSS